MGTLREALNRKAFLDKKVRRLIANVNLSHALCSRHILRITELFVCLPPLYCTLQFKGLLKSVTRGWNVSVDTTFHVHLFSRFNRRLTAPGRLQENRGGLVGQVWDTEQEALTLSFISTDRDGGGGSPEEGKYDTNVTHSTMNKIVHCLKNERNDLYNTHV